MVYEIKVVFSDGRSFICGPKKLHEREIDDFAKAVANPPLAIRLPTPDGGALIIPPEVARTSVFFLRKLDSDAE